MARPKKTTNDLPEGWKKKCLDLASEGASDVELRVTALGGISDDLWYRLIAEDEEFSRTIKKCKAACQQWWERKGRMHLENPKFNATLWYMNMKNRFGWKDKSEVSGDRDNPVLHKVIVEHVKPDHSAP